MLYDLLKSRRSIRKFKAQKVEAEKIDLLLKSGRLAPSARGIYPCQLIAVTDEALIAKLAKCKSSAGFLKGAPLAMVVLAECDRCDTWIEDASIAASFMQLMAEDLGLGSCWIHARERFYSDEIKTEDYIRDILDVPETFYVECILAIGYADEEKTAYDEESLLKEKIHYNKFK